MSWATTGLAQVDCAQALPDEDWSKMVLSIQQIPEFEPQKKVQTTLTGSGGAFMAALTGKVMGVNSFELDLKLITTHHHPTLLHHQHPIHHCNPKQQQLQVVVMQSPVQSQKAR